MLLAAGLIWFGLLVIVSMAVPGWCLFGMISLMISLYFHKETWSFHVFVIAVFFYMLSTPLTMVGLILIGMYVLYKFLNSRRLREIQKIASMTADQLAKVSYDQPEVEIIIHGGRRK